MSRFCSCESLMRFPPTRHECSTFPPQTLCHPGGLIIHYSGLVCRPFPSAVSESRRSGRGFLRLTWFSPLGSRVAVVLWHVSRESVKGSPDRVPPWCKQGFNIGSIWVPDCSLGSFLGQPCSVVSISYRSGCPYESDNALAVLRAHGNRGCLR